MDFQVESSQKLEIIDITDDVESRVDESEGSCTIFVPHTTAGLTLNENEERLLEDIKDFLQGFVPEKDYRHDRIDDNASSHLRNLLLDSSITIPVEEEGLQIGKWQSILFIELDGPRKRNINLRVDN